MKDENTPQALAVSAAIWGFWLAVFYLSYMSGLKVGQLIFYATAGISW